MMRRALLLAALLLSGCPGETDKLFDFDGDLSPDNLDCAPEDPSVFPGSDDLWGDGNGLQLIQRLLAKLNLWQVMRTDLDALHAHWLGQLGRSDEDSWSPAFRRKAARLAVQLTLAASAARLESSLHTCAYEAVCSGLAWPIACCVNNRSLQAR